jgi:hypothetical protein
VVGVFATNHQPQVLPPYFAARKNNPAQHNQRETNKHFILRTLYNNNLYGFIHLAINFWLAYSLRKAQTDS